MSISDPVFLDASVRIWHGLRSDTVIWDTLVVFLNFFCDRQFFVQAAEAEFRWSSLETSRYAACLDSELECNQIASFHCAIAATPDTDEMNCFQVIVDKVTSTVSRSQSRRRAFARRIPGRTLLEEISSADGGSIIYLFRTKSLRLADDDHETKTNGTTESDMESFRT